MTSSASGSGTRSLLLVDVGWGLFSLRLGQELVRAGLAVHLLTDSSYPSRCIPKGVEVHRIASTEPDRLLPLLDEAVRKLAPDVIVPVLEETLFRIWEADPPWLNLVHPAIPAESRHLYLDKIEFLEVARKRGVVVPKTIRLKSCEAEEVHAIIEILGIAVVVKGSRSCCCKNVRWAFRRSDAIEGTREIGERLGEPPALQEFYGGAVYVVGGVFDRGKPLSMYGARLIEPFAAVIGPSLLMESSNAPDLMEAAASVFRILNYTGIGSADFIRFSGVNYFLEVNPRPWESFAMAGALGVDLAGAWGRLLRNEVSVPPPRYRSRQGWAKMPDYLFYEAQNRREVLRRALHKPALASWSWHSLPLLRCELGQAWRGLRAGIKDTRYGRYPDLPPITIESR